MEESKDQAIRVLLVEDVEADAERALYQFRRAGIRCEARRVETEAALLARLIDFPPTVILSDFTLPKFDGLSALKVCREQVPDVPFLFVSGTIGEERAIAALQAGADDYVLKENLNRLVPAARRAISHAKERAERAAQDAQIRRMNRVLRMLSGVNEMVFRFRDRTELLTETCRLAIALGGYALAAAATMGRAGASTRAVLSSGLDEAATAQLRAGVEKSAATPGGAIATVFRTGRKFVRNQAVDLEATDQADPLLRSLGARSLVVLPLVVDGETSAVLVLVAQDTGMLGSEELRMLQDLTHSLSFGLQYVNRDSRVRFLSHFDPQTGLARRTLFCDRLRELIAQSRGARHAIAILDMRRLSAINDSFGRSTGDLLVRQVAERLKRHCPRQEQLAHLGGGTFAIACQLDAEADAASPAFGEALAQRLFAEPCRVDGRDIPLAARIAWTVAPEDGSDAARLLQDAEAALHFARATGRHAKRFDAEVRTHGVSQLNLEHRLRFALERNQFELHYQPKVDVVTRRIQGAEALLRWRSPEDGLVSPEAFLPVLESSGLIQPVGEWVVQQAARDCLAWQQARLPPVRIAVNISPAQLRHHEFEERFLQAVKPWVGLSRGLDIEITEGVLQEDCGAEITKLERLRAAGVRIAVDDFGTGYSSLSRLSALPVDTLKIDRRFVSQVVDSPAGAAVVKTVVALAHAFKMTTVAEGVERQQELDMLWQIGCNQSQGYLHCMPLRAEQFIEVIRSGKGKLVQPPAPEE